MKQPTKHGLRRMWHWRKRLPPTHPLYADAKLFGLALSTRVKLLVFFTATTMVLAVMYLVHTTDVNNQRHTQRVKDQQRTDQLTAKLAAEDAQLRMLTTQLRAQATANAQGIRTLACLVVSLIDPADFPPIATLSKDYDCPPFGTKTTHAPGAPILPTGTPGGPTPTPGQRTVTVTPGRPRPTTVTVTRAPPPIPLPVKIPPVLCKVLPQLCKG